MGKDYADPRFGVKKLLAGDTTASLASTVAATELMRFRFMEAVSVTDWNMWVKTGGTEASLRTILIGTSLAGTGAFSAIGTQTLGTLANGTTQDAALTATAIAAGDDIVIQHLGTGAAVYAIRPLIQYVEAFVNA